MNGMTGSLVLYDTIFHESSIQLHLNPCHIKVKVPFLFPATKETVWIFLLQQVFQPLLVAHWQRENTFQLPRFHTSKQVTQHIQQGIWIRCSDQSSKLTINQYIRKEHLGPKNSFKRREIFSSYRCFPSIFWLNSKQHDKNWKWSTFQKDIGRCRAGWRWADGDRPSYSSIGLQRARRQSGGHLAAADRYIIALCTTAKSAAVTASRHRPGSITP